MPTNEQHPAQTGFLVSTKAKERQGTHHAGGFNELIAFLKDHAAARPDWWAAEVATEQRLNPKQEDRLPKTHPDFAEWSAAKKQLSAFKSSNMPLVRAPGLNGDTLREAKAYAPAWDVLLLDFDQLPPVIDGAPAIEAMRDVLEDLQVRAVIHTTPTNSQQITKLRVVAHTVPLAMHSDGKTYDTTKGMDDRYHAAVLLEQAIVGGLGAVDCLPDASTNSGDWRYVLDTGEEITADRSTYKASQAAFVPFDDAEWIETDGEPVTLEDLDECAAPYGFPLVVEPRASAPAPARTTNSTPEAKPTSGKRERKRADGRTDPARLAKPDGQQPAHHKAVDDITQQTVDDIRAVLTDPRMIEQAQDYNTWIAVIGALNGEHARATPFADQFEAITIEWGFHGESFDGETAKKIRDERHTFKRSNPAAIFKLAESFGVPNPARGRTNGAVATIDENPLNRLEGALSCYINDEGRHRLDDLNPVYAHTKIGNKAVIAFRATQRIGDYDVAVWECMIAKELEAMNDHLPGIVGYRLVEDRKTSALVKKECKPVNLIRAWLHYPGHSIYPGGMEFYPDPTKCPPGVLNLFNGYNVEPKRGDVSLWLELVENVICSGNEDYAHILISFFAHMVQKPDEKPGFAIVLHGGKGAGKGSLMKPFRNILGGHYIHLQGLKHLAGRFNGGIMAAKLLALADEVRVRNAQEEDALKVYVTESTVIQERKGFDAEAAPNYLRIVIASNHEGIVRASENERRYFYLNVSSEYQSKDNPDNVAFWRDYNVWADSADGAAALLEYLQSYDISDFDPRRAPRTEALQAEMVKNLPEMLSFLMDELGQPAPFRIRPTAEQWEGITERDMFDEDKNLTRSTTPLNSGGVTSVNMGIMCANWINGKVNRFSAEDRTERNMRQPLAKAVQAVFGIQSTKTKKHPAFVFPDVNRARYQFAKHIDVAPLLLFPEIHYPGMEETTEQMDAEQSEYDE